MGRPLKKRKVETDVSSDVEQTESRKLADKKSKKIKMEDQDHENAARPNRRSRRPDVVKEEEIVHLEHGVDRVPPKSKRTKRTSDKSTSTSDISVKPPKKTGKNSRGAKSKPPAAVKEELPEELSLQVDEGKDDATQAALTLKTTSVNKGRKRAIPTIKKEKSDAAEMALRKLSEQMNDLGSDSDSDSSTEAAATTARSTVSKSEPHSGESDHDDSDDEMFEDVDLSTKLGASAKFDTDVDQSVDLELTLEKAERLQLAKTGKKKQSVRAIHERCFCHYMSAITMVAVGAWRNVWANDVRLHKLLRRRLKSKSSTLDSELANAAHKTSIQSIEFVELMGRVMKRFDSMFTRTKPGLRKLGHRPVSLMDVGKVMEDSAENFPNFEAVLEQARTMEGSRDFAALLFTSLLRAYHFRVRLVFSTQPLGYKFNEREECNASTVQQAQMFNTKVMDSQESAQSTAARTDTLNRQEPSNESSARKVIELASDSEESSGRKNGVKRESGRKVSQHVRSGTKHDAITLDDSDLSDLNSEDLVSDPDLLTDLEDLDLPDLTIPKVEKVSEIDSDLEYPIFWTEVFDPAKQQWMAIDATVKKAVFVDEKGLKSLHPKGSKAEQQKLTLGFVVAYDANKYAKDVTTRYASSWAKVKEVFLRADGKSNTRYDVNKILVCMSNPYRDEIERQEDETLAFKEVKRPPPDEMPKNLADFKQSPKYILDKHLREKEAFTADAKPIDIFSTGKGAKATTSKVYLRKDVVACKTIENYHKEGLRIKEGEQPRKMIKARAMTTNRIREHQQQLAETGEEHVMQGIYSLDQTEYIIPPPIRDGVIPKNAYGNADVFVESMIPQGATHLKLKGVARIARKMEIDHAEAVVGFEFKKRGAIPLVLGVLVADENAATLQAAWEEAEEIRIRKEDKKKSDAALKLWAKLLKGLRIRNRINAEYGILVNAEEEPDGSMTVPEPPTQKTLHEQIKGNEHLDDDQEQQDGGFVRD